MVSTRVDLGVHETHVFVVYGSHIVCLVKNDLDFEEITQAPKMFKSVSLSELVKLLVVFAAQAVVLVPVLSH